jgi:D-amino peptidase
MMKEVNAVCEGANNAGVKEIWIKDTHGVGRNLSFDNLPENVNLVKAFNGHPFGMMQELDNSFAAAIMVGYHSMAGSGGNPLAHTLDDEEIEWIKINDKCASEFLLNAYTASYVGVPVICVSGDEALCEHVKQINGNIRTISVGKGVGSSIISIHPKVVCKKLKEEVALALKGNMKSCMIELPRSAWKEH